mgnify:FL=1
MIPLNANLASLKRSAIRVYTNLARQTPDCAMLTIGEPDFDTPEGIRQAAWAALQQGQTHYAPNQGTQDLREAIAAYETRRGNATSPREVLVTVGSSQALFTALLGILNPGEEVIVPVPAFSLYETIITVAGGKMVPLDISATDFQIDAAALNRLITPKTKAIVLNSPNNPTGGILNRQSLEAVKQAVLGKPIFIVSDNVYSALSYAPCPDLSLDGALKEQLLLCQSFSKPYAMTGWRLGYLVCPEYVMERLLLLSAGMIAAVPTFVQAAGVAALREDVAPMREVYRRRRDYVTARLDAMGLRYPQPQGAFYVFPDIRKFGLSSDAFCQRLIQQGKLAAVPGSCFGVEGFLRLSYCYREQELEKGMDRLEDFLATL